MCKYSAERAGFIAAINISDAWQADSHQNISKATTNSCQLVTSPVNSPSGNRKTSRADGSMLLEVHDKECLITSESCLNQSKARLTENAQIVPPASPGYLLQCLKSCSHHTLLPI
jgi:hypothetical protein